MAVIKKRFPTDPYAGPTEGVGLGVPKIPYSQIDSQMEAAGLPMGPINPNEGEPEDTQMQLPGGMPGMEAQGGAVEEGGPIPPMGGMPMSEPTTDMMGDEEIAALADESQGNDLTAALDAGDPVAQQELAMAARRRLLGLMGGGIA